MSDKRISDWHDHSPKVTWALNQFEPSVINQQGQPNWPFLLTLQEYATCLSVPTVLFLEDF